MTMDVRPSTPAIPVYTELRKFPVMHFQVSDRISDQSIWIITAQYELSSTLYSTTYHHLSSEAKILQSSSSLHRPRVASCSGPAWHWSSRPANTHVRWPNNFISTHVKVTKFHKHSRCTWSNRLIMSSLWPFALMRGCANILHWWRVVNKSLPE